MVAGHGGCLRSLHAGRPRRAQVRGRPPGHERRATTARNHTPRRAHTGVV